MTVQLLKNCLHLFINIQVRSCDEKFQGRTRVKRNSKNTFSSDNVTDWQSYLEFKVVLPENGTQEINKLETILHWKDASWLLMLAGTGILLLITFIVLIVLSRKCNAKQMRQAEGVTNVTYNDLVTYENTFINS